ncbi:MAG: copper resistance protein B, partial [Gammaproteobacteria bacterium]|nr:copper resistance protein B [Gammaproteobacteria bacterium]
QRPQAEYELMLTRNWVLSLEVEINWSSNDDRSLEIGAGFADTEAGIRLRCEITREIAPYIGINHERPPGDTQDTTDARGMETSDTQTIAGLRFWLQCKRYMLVLPK